MARKRVERGRHTGQVEARIAKGKRKPVSRADWPAKMSQQFWGITLFRYSHDPCPVTPPSQLGIDSTLRPHLCFVPLLLLSAWSLPSGSQFATLFFDTANPPSLCSPYICLYLYKLSGVISGIAATAPPKKLALDQNSTAISFTTLL